MEQFSRIERMVGSSWVEQLQNKKVAVFGLGGVGSYVVEALARGGVGALVLVDHFRGQKASLRQRFLKIFLSNRIIGCFFSRPVVR